MAAANLTYSDLRYWYLSEIRQLKKAQYDGNANRNMKELKALRCSLAELRVARRGSDSAQMTTEGFLLRPWR